MADSAAILARLRSTAPDGPLARLARLLVDDALARPVADLVDAKAVAAAARAVLAAATASDATEKFVTARAEQVLADVDSVKSAVSASDATEKFVTARAEQVLADVDSVKSAVSTLVPTALRDGARALAALPMTPKHDAVMRILDRDPLKQLLRGQIVDTLVQFGRRAASPVADNPIAKGLGGLGKLAGGLASASPLGRVASAVSGEVERQVEKRASDFADTAVAGVLEGIATQASDPARAKEQAALRVAILDGLLELAGSDYAELGRGHVPAQVAVVRKQLAAWSADAAFLADVERAVAQAVSLEAGRTLGELLTDLAVRDVVAEHAQAIVERELRRFVGGDAFAGWLTDLVS
jgi:hypothetical protein